MSDMTRIDFSAPDKYARPQDYAVERQEAGLFRCDRCAMLWPLPWFDQDGFNLCRRCQDPLSPLEAQTSMAEDRARASSDPMEMLELPVTGCTTDAICVTAVSPLTVTLTRGGASQNIAITGVNLSASDTWSSNNSGHITVTPTVNSTTSVTLAVSADGTTTRADYNLTFNGDTLTPRGILKVR